MENQAGVRFGRDEILHELQQQTLEQEQRALKKQRWRL